MKKIRNSAKKLKNRGSDIVIHETFKLEEKEVSIIPSYKSPIDKITRIRNEQLNFFRPYMMKSPNLAKKLKK